MGSDRDRPRVIRVLSATTRSVSRFRPAEGRNVVAALGRPLRFLFLSLGHVESDFYGRVGQRLRQDGHEVAHVTYSRHAARRLARNGETAWCLPDRMADLEEPIDFGQEVSRIIDQYETPTFRDIYRADPVCEEREEAWCVERTVRHLLAIEQIFDEWRPDVLIPEVGNETLRVAGRLVGVRRRVPVLFLFYTVFPRPLRIYVDTMHAPIVEPEALRPLSQERLDEVEAFIAEFTRRRAPIREPRESKLTLHRTRMFMRHLWVKARWDRDNDYLLPFGWLGERILERIRAVSVRRFYDNPRGGRPFVYFPLHVTDDYKIKRVIPHCADQADLVEQVANALPHGWDLVAKEHPMDLGRTPAALLKRLTRIDNVRVVPPVWNSHDLIEQSEAVVVISSTVGLEALLYDKPVLTLGQPFYSGLGVTMDVDSFAEIRDAVPAVLKFRPDRTRVREFLSAAMERCYPGAPVLVDRSDSNAATLARSIEAAAEGVLRERRRARTESRRGPRRVELRDEDATARGLGSV
jgi:hypothetical protein